MFSSNTSQQSEGYQIQRSLRFNSADSAYLNRTPASATNRRTWTYSGWVKRSSLSGSNTPHHLMRADVSGAETGIRFEDNYTGYEQQLRLYSLGSGGINLVSAAKYRDFSAWYHVVVAVDTTQATAANRVKMYVNGSEITQFSVATYPDQNYQTSFNATTSHAIGATPSALEFFNGYMTEVNFIDGQALTPSSFGQTNANTGVWEPKPYAGTYGTNGFYLNFSDNSNTTATTLGKDYSGNGNNWTPNNFSVSAGAGNDSLVDVPTAWGTDTGVGGTVRGNYCTLNPLDSALTLLDGNLRVGAPTDWRSVRATFGITSGKWYWEVNPGSAFVMIGISTAAASQTSYVGNDANGWSYYGNTGNKYNSGASTAYGAAYSSSDVIGVAFDADAGTLTFYKNNTSQGTAFSGLTSGPYFPALGVDNNVSNTNINFGQRPFAYTAPSGFKALCTQNLPTPTIGATAATQAGKYFNAVIYTPTSYPAVTTGVGFQPDFTWWKNRVRGEGHILFDVLRGSNLFLRSNTTAADDTQTNGWVANSDGWTSSSGSYTLNEAYVAWNWKANGAGVTNTAGSITSTVSANTTSGFSVVTFTAQSSGTSTVGHGLGAAPKMLIFKSRTSGTDNWATYHASLGSGQIIYLNLTNSAAGSVVPWNSTSPTSSVFTLGTGFAGLGNMVAYCFAEVPGFSKFGSYTSNNSADGPFLYCGFRPAYVMIKNTTDPNASWIVYDNKRNTANVETNWLLPNASNAEGTDASLVMDFTSNGIKIRGNGLSINSASNSYIFAAFAEFPQKFSLAR